MKLRKVSFQVLLLTIIHLLICLTQNLQVPIHARQSVGNFLAVLWLKLQTSNAGAKDLIPAWGNKIPHAV